MKISNITKLLVSTLKGLDKDSLPEVWDMDAQAFSDKYLDQYGNFDELSKVFNTTYYGHGCVSKFDPEFPDLSHVPVKERPSVLFYKGDITLLSNRDTCVAMIGSRGNKGVIDKDVETRFTNVANVASENGYTIVSGLAIGSDTVAHKAAVASGKPTVAVLSTELTKVYPAVNKGFADEIVKSGGLLVSEYFTPAREDRREFITRLVARDRLQAAFSSKVVLSYSTTKGGSRHACNHATSYNVPVFVLKAPNMTSAFGLNNLLVSEGRAKVITHGDCK